MNQSQLVRSASSIGMAGTAGQVLYGALAVFFPYPTITDSGFEVLWALANIGMVAGIVRLLALDVAQPRSAALLGGGLAILRTRDPDCSLWLAYCEPQGKRGHGRRRDDRADVRGYGHPRDLHSQGSSTRGLVALGAARAGRRSRRCAVLLHRQVGPLHPSRAALRAGLAVPELRRARARQGRCLRFPAHT